MLKAKANTFAAHMGIEFLRLADGEAELVLEIPDVYLNNAGLVHGGVLATMADTAAGAANMSELADGDFGATTDLHITYMKSTTAGPLYSFAKVIHRSRRMAVAEAEIRSNDRDGVLLCKAQVTLMTVEKR